MPNGLRSLLPLTRTLPTSRSRYLPVGLESSSFPWLLLCSCTGLPAGIVWGACHVGPYPFHLMYTLTVPQATAQYLVHLLCSQPLPSPLSESTVNHRLLGGIGIFICAHVYLYYLKMSQNNSSSVGKQSAFVLGFVSSFATGIVLAEKEGLTIPTLWFLGLLAIFGAALKRLSFNRTDETLSNPIGALDVLAPPHARGPNIFSGPEFIQSANNSLSIFSSFPYCCFD